MKRIIPGLILLLGLFACRHEEPVIRFAVTTDVHGMIFPYDFTQNRPSDHSLSQVYSYLSRQDQTGDTLVLLMDNGDFLQGQPTVYYFNFIDPSGTHLSARVMNFMGYDAGTVGNHDIEAGPAVYEKIRKELDFPWLAANAVYKSTGTPAFEPYTVLKAGGKHIAVLGMITPGIPGWLPENLWPGMEFRDMVETAGEWVPRILRDEKPDLLVGLFHSGTDDSYGGNPGPYLNENASLLVAKQVPGFDVIFAGHDHRNSIQWVMNPEGDSVLVVDPGSHARYVGEVTVTFRKDEVPGIEARNVPMNAYPSSAAFDGEFESARNDVLHYLADTVTMLTAEINGRDALFGPSSITSLIHRVQLDLTGADLSFTAPLSASAVLEPGPLLVSDMFRLYRYENMLYAMELTGREIDGFMEYAAGEWFNRMTGPGDHLLLFSSGEPERLANPYFNFSSAAGIDYTVDVSKPAGERITISGFSNGRIFRPEEKYLVAINSYRGNGGGGHLTRGAGIPLEELKTRIEWSTDTDIRFYVMEYLKNHNPYSPEVIKNWQCVPRDWVSEASVHDLQYLH